MERKNSVAEKYNENQHEFLQSFMQTKLNFFKKISRLEFGLILFMKTFEKIKTKVDRRYIENVNVFLKGKILSNIASNGKSLLMFKNSRFRLN